MKSKKNCVHIPHSSGHFYFLSLTLYLSETINTAIIKRKRTRDEENDLEEFFFDFFLFERNHALLSWKLLSTNSILSRTEK